MSENLPVQEEPLSSTEALAIAAALLTLGVSTKESWRREARRVHERFVDRLRHSLSTQGTEAELNAVVFGGRVGGARRRGELGRAQVGASAWVSTVLSRIVNDARLRIYQANTKIIKAIQQISVLDNKTSDVCIAYSGSMWELESLKPLPPSRLPYNGGPPRHMNCRSTIVPVLKSWQELGLEDTVENKARYPGTPPQAFTFDSWLSSKSKRFQEELLGASRAKLWREGKITLTQLVDMRGNPLTLEQLAKKIANKRPTS